MSGSGRPPTTVRRDHCDQGFTLVELLIALVLSGIIAGVIVAALATSLNVASSTTKLVSDSTDAGLISAFLYRDGQSAGATDPATTLVDPSVGVAATGSNAGWGGCTQPGSFVARFSWYDRQTVSTRRLVVTTYALDGTQRLVRRLCQNGTTADIVLSHVITSATAACSPDPSCGATTTAVAMTVKGAVAQSPFTYTLTATLRAERQAQATVGNSASVSLLAFGGSAGSMPCPNLTMGGTGLVKVIGDVVVGSSCDASPVKGNAVTLAPTGTIRPISGVVDPFVGITPLTTACGRGTNPAPIGASPAPDAVVVYPTAVSITSAVAFSPGRYVFCNGLDIGVGATVTGAGVFMFVPGGTFGVNAAATVTLAAPTSGTYANLLVWIATSQQVVVNGGPNVSTYAGYIYAPTSQFTATGTGAGNIGGVIAQGVAFGGTMRARLGLPVPGVAVGPAVLPGGQIGVVYAPTTLVATGGTAPYSWSATGLPAGIALDAAAGGLSGGPTIAGTFNVIVTVLDATSAATSVNYTITVNPVLAIAAPATLPTGQVGVTFASTMIGPSGGTAPFAWTAAGLPAGLTVAAATGVVSGSPAAPGQFTVSATVTDAVGATAVRIYPLTIRAALAVTPHTMPPGQVGVVYAATTFAATGGLAPYAWSATGLPGGLVLNVSSGAITGTPTVAGSFAVVVKAVDAIGAAATSSAALITTPVLGVATTQLPSGQVGVASASTTLTPSGGTPPYTWAATGLPAGLILNPSTGVLGGTPSAGGTFNIVATVLDATATASSANYTVVINPVLAIANPAAIPSGQAGVTYAATTVSPSGGTAPFTWAAAGLPAGLTMSATTGVISGSPAASGSFTVAVTVTDAIAASAARTYALTVRPALAIAAFTLPPGQLSAAYAGTTLVATGGSTPYSWSATGLPTGLLVNAATGVVSGTPTVTGSFTVVVTVTDAVAATATTSTALSITSSVPVGCPLNPVGWRGEYFGNIALTGVAVLCRDDASINFDWAYSSPAASIPVDNFSARWTRTQVFAAGTYTFSLGSDDGSRLYIDGVLALDRWVDQGYPSPVPTVDRVLTAGLHTIVMEYYERGGAAKATLTWAVAATSTCPLSPSGWKGEYYSNISLTGPITMCRDDPSVNFDWGAGAPAASMPVDGFSVRWTRTQAFVGGLYNFALGTDDGGRLYIDGVLVLDVWGDQSYPSPVPSVFRLVTTGSHTIVVEYYERSGDARATLTW